MAWEQRGNNWYYYRKRRQGKRIISEYVGTGEYAYLISILDEEERAEYQYKLDELKRLKVDVKNTNRDIDQLSGVINGLLRATLLLSEYHPHKGQWRKTRDK